MFKNLDAKSVFSTLWIVIMFNMLFADVLTLFISENLQELVAGTTPVEITPELLLGMAVIIEIPIIMIFLSKVLSYKANRVANIVAAFITILFVVGGGSLEPHYVFFASVEVLCALLIINTAWKWAKPSNS